MGGRIYDPLAARFTTADPIMQAPFWSQGQNRYAYVFNDPINATDPSGFSVDGRDVSDGVSSGAAMGWLPGGMGLAILLRGAGAAGAGSALGGAVGVAGGLGNVAMTFSLTPGVLTPGSSWQTASPATAPTSSLNKANAMASAPAQAAPPGPIPMPDRSNPFAPPDLRVAQSNGGQGPGESPTKACTDLLKKIGNVEFPGFSGQIVDVIMRRAGRNAPARS